MKIGAATGVCAIFGNPVGHSLSPTVHNAAFAAAGLDLVYLAFAVPDPGPAFAAARALGFRGISVTIPHKESALAFMDELDPLARAMGAINTVVNDGGRLIGYNTDIDGVAGALEAYRVDLSGRIGVIIGSGGGARAAAFGMLHAGRPEQLFIVARNAEKGNALAEVVRAAHAGLGVNVVSGIEAIGLARRKALLINTTPVGMLPRTGDTPVPAALLGRDHVVFDMVYNPLVTRLLREAAAAGATVIGGDEMFMRQAFRQFALWTGQPVPRHAMADAFREAIAART